LPPVVEFKQERPKHIHCFCLIPDSLVVAAGMKHGQIRLFDFTGNTAEDFFAGYKSTVTAINILPDHKSWAVGYQDGTIRLMPLPPTIASLRMRPFGEVVMTEKQHRHLLITAKEAKDECEKAQAALVATQKKAEGSDIRVTDLERQLAAMEQRLHACQKEKEAALDVRAERNGDLALLQQRIRLLEDDLATANRHLAVAKDGEKPAQQALAAASKREAELHRALEDLKSVAAGKDKELKALVASMEAKDATIRRFEKETKDKAAAFNAQQAKLKEGHAIEVQKLKDKMSVAGQETAKLRDSIKTLEKSLEEEKRFRAISSAAEKALDKERKEHEASQKKAREQYEGLVAQLVESHEAEMQRLKRELAEAKEEAVVVGPTLVPEDPCGGAAGSECICCFEPVGDRVLIALPCRHSQGCVDCKARSKHADQCVRCQRKIDARLQVLLY
jgi:hypothetical protein